MIYSGSGSYSCFLSIFENHFHTTVLNFNLSFLLFYLSFYSIPVVYLDLEEINIIIIIILAGSGKFFLIRPGSLSTSLESSKNNCNF